MIKIGNAAQYVPGVGELLYEEKERTRIISQISTGITKDLNGYFVFKAESLEKFLKKMLEEFGAVTYTPPKGCDYCGKVGGICPPQCPNGFSGKGKRRKKKSEQKSVCFLFDGL